jgi:hypothetical protein
MRGSLCVLDLCVARIAPFVPHSAFRRREMGAKSAQIILGGFSKGDVTLPAPPSEQRGQLRHSNSRKFVRRFFAHLLLVNLFTPRPRNKLLEKMGASPHASTAPVRPTPSGSDCPLMPEPAKREPERNDGLFFRGCRNALMQRLESDPRCEVDRKRRGVLDMDAPHPRRPNKTRQINRAIEGVGFDRVIHEIQ